MCNDAACGRHPGEVEFRQCQQTMGPDDVIFAQEAQASALRYGVAINVAAWQWEIVAVESNRKRHIAFVSPQYRLEQVLGLAGGWTRSATAVSH